MQHNSVFFLCNKEKMWGSMAFTICLIVAFFNNKFTIKIFRKVHNFLITDCINVFCIRICFPFSLHIIKLLFVIKVSRHHINKIIELHHAFYLQIPTCYSHDIIFFLQLHSPNFSTLPFGLLL